MKKERRAIPVSYLNPKDKFEFANLSTYKDMEIKRNTDCGTHVQGSYKQGEDGAWKSLSAGHVISNNSLVFLVE